MTAVAQGLVLGLALLAVGLTKWSRHSQVVFGCELACLLPLLAGFRGRGLGRPVRSLR
ncbi:MAG TPA: hypothetical protein VF933_30050 [Streptosporangiaceae bacterium]